MDPRVEIAAQGIHDRAYGDNGTEQTLRECSDDARAAIAALEAAGYSVVKLEQVGESCEACGWTSSTPDDCGCGRHGRHVPVYRIVEDTE